MGMGKIYTKERGNTIWMEWHCIQRGESYLCVVLCYTNVQLQASKQHIYPDVNNCHVACWIIKNESFIFKFLTFLVYWEFGGGGGGEYILPLWLYHGSPEFNATKTKWTFFYFIKNITNLLATANKLI
jgi:hypothetical protein